MKIQEPDNMGILKTIYNGNYDSAIVVTALMGLGHARAAAPLSELSEDGILIYNSAESPVVTPKEKRVWSSTKKLYYFMSGLHNLPLIGPWLFSIMDAVLRIPPYYPMRDLSRPTIGALWLHRIIRKKGLCSQLIKEVELKELPVINTFYATALEVDSQVPDFDHNYLVVTDTDINRVWVPRHPESSNIKYLVPCHQARRRLISYGIRKSNVFITGFPLPKENIGSRFEMEILKEDLFKRLLRLDPKRRFLPVHQDSIRRYLDRNFSEASPPGKYTLMFAIGGSGVQYKMTRDIILSLKDKILNSEVDLYFSAGINENICDFLITEIKSAGLGDLLDDRIRIAYDPDVNIYFRQFNKLLRDTDILWTKPSELSFYCGLGIPLIISAPVGHHEKLNRRWLREIHAGISQPGPASSCAEWLDHLVSRGRLAQSAWNGFINARTLGSYKIEELVLKGVFDSGVKPMGK